MRPGEIEKAGKVSGSWQWLWLWWSILLLPLLTLPNIIDLHSLHPTSKASQLHKQRGTAANISRSRTNRAAFRIRTLQTFCCEVTSSSCSYLFLTSFWDSGSKSLPGFSGSKHWEIGALTCLWRSCKSQTIGGKKLALTKHSVHKQEHTHLGWESPHAPCFDIIIILTSPIQYFHDSALSIVVYTGIYCSFSPISTQNKILSTCVPSNICKKYLVLLSSCYFCPISHFLPLFLWLFSCPDVTQLCLINFSFIVIVLFFLISLFFLHCNTDLCFCCLTPWFMDCLLASLRVFCCFFKYMNHDKN